MCLVGFACNGRSIRVNSSPDWHRNPTECKTSFNNGVLELAFGKKEQQKKEPKRITIS